MFMSSFYFGLLLRRYRRLCCYSCVWSQECGQINIYPDPHQYVAESVSSHN